MQYSWLREVWCLSSLSSISWPSSPTTQLKTRRLLYTVPPPRTHVRLCVRCRYITYISGIFSRPDTQHVLYTPPYCISGVVHPVPRGRRLGLGRKARRRRPSALPPRKGRRARGSRLRAQQDHTAKMEPDGSVRRSTGQELS